MANERLLPKPAFLGLPEKYSAFRPTQARAVYDIDANDRRGSILNMPTGSGKSMVPFAVAAVEGARVLTLTATRALEDQYEGDFHSTGMVDIRGAGNYPCKALAPGGELQWLSSRREPMADHCAHRSGIKCSLRFGGCDYYDRIGAVRNAQTGTSNYAYWISIGKAQQGKQQQGEEESGESLGNWDYLCMDEFHSAADELGRALQIKLSMRTLQEINEHTPEREDIGEWKEWATFARNAISVRIEDSRLNLRTGSGGGHALDDLRELQRLDRSLAEIASIDGDWVCENRWDSEGFATQKVVQFDPVWPGPYAERLLFRGIPHLIGMSGTASLRTPKYLNMPEESFRYFEYPSPFPLTNRPIYFMPKVRMHYGNTPGDLAIWAGAIDNILRQRTDRKVIILTVSYRRAQQLLSLSRYSSRMFTHEPKAKSTAEAVKRMHTDRRQDLVLVSPSIGTGYDFPFDAAEVCIIAKTPWPSMDSKVVKARIAQDRDYTNYYAAQEITQYGGRVVRDVRDRGEVFVVDSSAGALFKRRDLFAGYIRAAVRYIERVPPAPPRVRRAA